MDCTSYSYTAPGFGITRKQHTAPADSVTILRKTSAAGTYYYTVKRNLGTPEEGYIICHSIKDALESAQEFLTGD